MTIGKANLQNEIAVQSAPPLTFTLQAWAKTQSDDAAIANALKAVEIDLKGRDCDVMVTGYQITVKNVALPMQRLVRQKLAAVRLDLTAIDVRSEVSDFFDQQSTKDRK